MALPRQTLSVNEYFALESRSELRYEYVRGEVFAMAGASEAHNQLTFNLSGMLYSQLRSTTCRAFAVDMRVGLAEDDYSYPDLVVVCGEAQFMRQPLDTLLNPTLIIEVASPSTAAYDRGEKFLRYRQLASLREYILIEQARPYVEQYSLQAPNRWLLHLWQSLDDSPRLESVGCQLPLREVYEGVLKNEGYS